MPAVSKVMIALGILLIGCAPVGWATGDSTISMGLGNGLAMIAAGVAAAQGRRSLRLAGLYLGLFVPAFLAITLGWHARDLWKQQRDGGGGGTAPALICTFLAVAMLAGFIVLLRLRVKSNSLIAERGYSLTTPTQLAAPAPQAPTQPLDHT